MKQIVDKLNKIAKKIDESVEIPQTDLIIDSLDAITKAYGGTPNDSNLIVDKLEDIYNNISPAVSGNIEITENGENINVAPYATATVNVSGGGLENPILTVSFVNEGGTINLWDILGETAPIPIINNKIITSDSVNLTGSTTTIVGFVISEGYDGSYPLIEIMINNYISNSDNVNCTETTTAKCVEVYITDPTKNASITVTITDTK